MKARITEAKLESYRFIRRADEALRRMEEDKTALYSGTKEFAAMRRTSMDLTRALAEVRKPKIGGR